MGIETKSATAAITAQNTFTGWVYGRSGTLDVWDTSSGSMTVTLQSNTSESATGARDDDSVTAAGLYGFGFDSGEKLYWRAGVKTGAYTSGTFTLTINTSD